MTAQTSETTTPRVAIVTGAGQGIGTSRVVVGPSADGRPDRCQPCPVKGVKGIASSVGRRLTWGFEWSAGPLAGSIRTHVRTGREVFGE